MERIQGGWLVDVEGVLLLNVRKLEVLLLCEFENLNVSQIHRCAD